MESQDSGNRKAIFAHDQSLLRERLQGALDALSAELRADVHQALEEKGKLFALADESGPLPEGSWALLTLLIARDLAPQHSLAYRSDVALASECYICALDILDDLEDEDRSPLIQRIGAARALNISTALLALAQHFILSLSSLAFPHERLVRLLEAMQTATLTAVAGQHRDLLAEQKSIASVSFEDCIDIAAAKAGALMSLACQLGAISAGVDSEMCERFITLGSLLGIAHQLDNDSHDLYHLLQEAPMEGQRPEAHTHKTDLLRGKKTLPIVLAAQSENHLKKVSRLTDNEKVKYQRSLHEGIITTWGICLLYRERAYEQLQKIVAQQPLSPALLFLLGFAEAQV